MVVAGKASSLKMVRMMEAKALGTQVSWQLASSCTVSVDASISLNNTRNMEGFAPRHSRPKFAAYVQPAVTWGWSTAWRYGRLQCVPTFWIKGHLMVIIVIDNT